MANEIKNREHACALIAPEPAPPFTTPIVSEVGLSRYTRNGPGNYTIELLDAAPFHTHRVVTQLGANVLGSIGGQLINGGAAVLVTAFDAAGAPADPQFFTLSVETIRDGEGAGPEPAAPAVPTPPASGGLTLGWVRVKANGTFTQSASGIVQSVAPWAGLPGVSLITLVPGTVAGAVVVSQDLNGGAPTLAATPIAEVVTPTTINVQAGTGPTPGTDYYASILGV